MLSKRLEELMAEIGAHGELSARISPKGVEVIVRGTCEVTKIHSTLSIEQSILNPLTFELNAMRKEAGGLIPRPLLPEKKHLEVDFVSEKQRRIEDVLATIRGYLEGAKAFEVHADFEITPELGEGGFSGKEQDMGRIITISCDPWPAPDAAKPDGQK